MKLELLDSLSLPGDPAKANEDSFGHDAVAAVVIDGATPLGDSLMPGPSDAAWIAQFGARRLMAHLRDGASFNGKDWARKALRSALADTQKSFEALRRHEPEEMWQTPCGSMMLAVPDKDGVEFLWFGDCAGLVRPGDGRRHRHRRDLRQARRGGGLRAQGLAKEKNLSPASGINRPEFLEHLRAARNRINSGTYWLFSPDAKAASHVSRRIVKCAPGGVILLASDGLLALASDYGAYNADTLMAAALDKGLAALGEELRAIEAGDRHGRQVSALQEER